MTLKIGSAIGIEIWDQVSQIGHEMQVGLWNCRAFTITRQFDMEAMKLCIESNTKT